MTIDNMYFSYTWIRFISAFQIRIQEAKTKSHSEKVTKIVVKSCSKILPE